MELNDCKVNLFLRKDKKGKDGTYPVNILVTLNSETFRLGGIKKARLKLNQWDEKAKQPRNNVPHINKLRKTLNNAVNRVIDFVEKANANDSKLSKKDLRDLYYKRKKPKRDFFDYYQEFMDLKFPTIAETTKKPYSLLKKQLEEYQSFKEINILFVEDMDYNFFRGFFKYLREEEETGNSGLATRRKNLITIFEEFMRMEIISKNPCKRIGRFKEKEKTIFLNFDELNSLRNLILDRGKKNEGLEYSRGLFLFSCYTGLRYCDIMQLKWKNVRDNALNFVQKKTGGKVYNPLLKEANEIIKTFGGSNFENVFEYRANATINRDLKILAEDSEIEKHLTFHVGRHTFGSILAQNNVQAFYIAQLMGHTDVRMTSRYVNSNQAILQKAMENIRV